jgi:hypothetical protein
MNKDILEIHGDLYEIEKNENLKQGKVCVNHYFMDCTYGELFSCKSDHLVCYSCSTWYSRNYCIQCIRNKILNKHKEKLMKLFIGENGVNGRMYKEAMRIFIEEFVKF